MFGVFARNPAFRYLALGQFVSFVGDWFNIVALVTLLGRDTGGALSVAVVTVLKQLPIFLLTPLSGVVADRADRRRIMLISDLVRIPLTLALVFVGADRNLIFLLIGLSTCASAFFEPARFASLPQLVEARDVRVANSASALVWQFGMLFGVAFGGVCTEFIGVKGAFLLDAGSYLLSAFFISRLPAIPSQDPSDARTQVTYREFLRERLSTQERMTATTLKGLFGLGGACYVVQLLIGRDFHLGETGATGVSVALLARVSGAMAGGFLCAHLLRKKAELNVAQLGLLLSAVGYICMGLSEHMIPILCGLAIGHIGSSLLWIASNHLIHRIFERNERGRAFGLDFGLHTLTSSASMLVFARMIDASFLSISAVSIGCGVLWLVSVAILQLRKVP